MSKIAQTHSVKHLLVPVHQRHFPHQLKSRIVLCESMIIFPFLLQHQGSIDIMGHPLTPSSSTFQKQEMLQLQLNELILGEPNHGLN